MKSWVVKRAENQPRKFDRDHLLDVKPVKFCENMTSWGEFMWFASNNNTRPCAFRTRCKRWILWADMPKRMRRSSSLEQSERGEYLENGLTFTATLFFDIHFIYSHDRCDVTMAYLYRLQNIKVYSIKVHQTGQSGVGSNNATTIRRKSAINDKQNVCSDFQVEWRSVSPDHTN